MSADVNVSSPTNAEAGKPPASPLKKAIIAYFIVYGLLFVVWLTYRFTASEPMTPAAYLQAAFPGIRAGDSAEAAAKLMVEEKAKVRLWAVIVFTDLDGQQHSIPPGATLNRLEAIALARVMAAELEKKDGQKKIENLIVHKPGGFANLPWAAFMTVYNLLGLFLLLYAAAGKPLSEFLETYRQDTATALRQARAAQAEAEALKKRYQDLIAEVEAEKETLAATAETESREEHERIIQETRKEAEEILESMKTRMNSEIEAAARRLRVQVSQEAITLAAGMLREEVNAADHDRTVDAFVDDIEKAQLR